MIINATRLSLIVRLLTIFLTSYLFPVTAVEPATRGFIPSSTPQPHLVLSSPIGGFDKPIFVTGAGDGSNRLFVVDQIGRIYIVKNGAVLSTPFLDITNRVRYQNGFGLMSLAFPPGYAGKGHFYVYYMNLSGNPQIARFRITSNPDIADANSQQEVLTVPALVDAGHIGGQIAFSPRDGYLYLAVGDGEPGAIGSEGDPSNRAQDPSQFHGKMLRVDVETANPATYTIPASNPFINRAGYRPEIWALGLRNPWRFSFDRQTDDLYIGDNGQDLYEEVDFQPASSAGGENYGWRIMEGNHCYAPSSGCSTAGLTLPILEYAHTSNCASVIGGFVYRGAGFPGLQGVYLYLDYCTGQISGLYRQNGTWQNTVLLDTNLPYTFASFGEDEQGNIYAAATFNGSIYKILDATSYSGGPKIVFGSVRNGGDHDIYVMGLDGSNQTRLTSHPAYDDQPKWSPDGNKIAFMSDRSGNFDVYVMNADGTNQTRLTNNPAAEGFPVWSPDGTKIAFVLGDLRNPSTFEIYVMNADGSNRIRLTNDSMIDGVPAWSPDGTKIVFMSGGPNVFDPNSFEIFVINSDGSNRVRLTNNTVVDGQPSFSPDGTRILFAGGDAMNPNGIEIYVMNVNGSNRIQLTNNSVTDGFPAWSPDGTKIIFASGDVFTETGVELFVMNADGSNRARLTTNSSLDWFADWQPTVIPPWQPTALAANQIELRVWTIQGRTYAYVRPQFPNAGYRIASWGQVGRSGNDFNVDANVERFIGLSVQSVVTTAQIYDLGPLANGTYNFNFKASGTLAKTLQFTISSTVPPPNPIDDARTFVKQQYRDFLNREADQAGEDFWTDNITKCSDPARRPPGQTVEQCTLRQRETTSGAFFLSPEFQYTGYYVYRMYVGALGRQPKLSEFMPDALFVGNGIIVNGQLSAAKINQNKADFAAQFVNCTDATKYRCAEFKAIYEGLSAQQYVDKLFQTTGINASASDRTALANGLNHGTETPATVLQKIVDGINVISEGNQQFTTTYGQAFYNAEFNRAFVQLEYFGYMKRDPDEAGYAFWLGKLNQFNGDFVAAEMVLAFISSPEYRARFGQP